MLPLADTAREPGSGYRLMTFSLRMQAWRRLFAQWLMRSLFRGGRQPTPATDTLPLTGIHRVLVCRNVRTLGDSLTLTPLLQAVGRTWPGAEIDLVSRCPVAEEIYGTYFGIGRIIRLPLHPPGHPLQTLRALRHMRSAHYDLAIDPDPQSQSGRLLALLARKTRSLGFSDPHKSGTMTHAVGTTGMPKHHAMQPVFLLRSALGKRATDAPYPCLDIRLSASERQRGRRALDGVLAKRPSSARGCIGLFADATGAKRFDDAWWNRFLQVFEPCVTDYALIEVLSGTGHSLLDNRYPCFYSGHVRKLASVLANLSFFISADCGVMHLGSAVGVPTTGVFKVTEPSEWGPYGNANFAIDARSLTAEATAAEVLSLFRATAARWPAGSTEHCTKPADE